MLIRNCECGERLFGLEVFCPECGTELPKIFHKDPDQKDRDAWECWVGAFCGELGHQFQKMNQHPDYRVKFCANCGERLVGEKEGCTEEDHILQCAGAHMKFNCPDCGKEIDPG